MHRDRWRFYNLTCEWPATRFVLHDAIRSGQCACTDRLSDRGQVWRANRKLPWLRRCAAVGLFDADNAGLAQIGV